MLSATPVCYFVLKPSVWRAVAVTEHSGDIKLKSAVHTHTLTHTPRKGYFFFTQDFYSWAELEMSLARHATLIIQSRVPIESVLYKQPLTKSAEIGEEAHCCSRDFTSWRVRCLPSFLFESNLPYIALYFLISSSL